MTLNQSTSRQTQRCQNPQPGTFAPRRAAILAAAGSTAQKSREFGVVVPPSGCCGRDARAPFYWRQTPAFTLIELVLAIAVASIVLAAINAAFFSAVRLRETTLSAVDATVPAEQAITVLRRDLQCAMPPGGIMAGDFKAGNVTSIGIGQTVSLEVYTATGALDENEPWGDVQRVTYELKDPADRSSPGKDLVRSVTRNILTTGTPDIEDQWLMGNVQNLAFTCFDGTTWQNTWDTTDTSTMNTNLPVAVRVRIQLAGASSGGAASQPIELVVPIVSQTRTNVTTTIGS
jgi:prepilin-type N-terminal cleavage/methylation domain-containing protein